MFEQYQEMGSGGNEKKVWKVLLIIIIISSLGAVAYAGHYGVTLRWLIPGTFNIETLPISDIGTNYVTLNGNATFDVSSVVVWFEYGRNKDSYTFRTINQTKTSSGNFSQKVEGIQLMPDTLYYFRAVGTGSGIDYGDDITFTTSALTPFEDKNFGKNYDELKEGKFNMSSLAKVLPKTYTDMMLQSNIFYGLFFGLIFMVIWIRQEDVVLPALLGMTVGASIFIFLPAEWMKLAQSLFVISLSAGVYSLIKGRK